MNSDIQEIKLSRSLRSIGRRAFNNCLHLKSVKIPSGVQLECVLGMASLPDSFYNECGVSDEERDVLEGLVSYVVDFSNMEETKLFYSLGSEIVVNDAGHL